MNLPEITAINIFFRLFLHLYRLQCYRSSNKQTKSMRYWVLVNIAILLAYHLTTAQENCPAFYLRFSQNHSFCQPPNPTCQIQKNSLTKSEIEVILKEHNSRRNTIATGKEGRLPSASNMLEMVWDDELASVAQKYANQCLFQHDCSNCRRVRNFGVGQNLAYEYITNSPKVPESNWPQMIKNWYDEVQYFPENAIDTFIKPPPPKSRTYGHFTQVIWADTWRIGCGYVLYTEGNVYKKLYVCNYGPAGNIVPRPTYKRGSTCSKCPENSCCGKKCDATDSYLGLCKINDNKTPVYKPEATYFFYCNYQNQTDCGVLSTPDLKKWSIYNTLSGNFGGIILKGGEKNSITFSTKLKPQSGSFCFVISYRKGSNKDGGEDNIKATETFKIVPYNREVYQDLPTYSGSLKHQFSRFTMDLAWNYETEFKLTVSVPPDKPDQFFEMNSIYAYEGKCKK